MQCSHGSCLNCQRCNVNAAAEDRSISSLLSKPPVDVPSSLLQDYRKADLVVRETLDCKSILDLIDGEILAVHIHNYFPADQAGEMAERLMTHKLFGQYENAPDIGRVGMALFETLEKEANFGLYHEVAIPSIHALRLVFSPYLSPLDKFRLELQEMWPASAHLLNLDGRQAFIGLARVFEGGAEALPHQDILRRDVPEYTAAHEVSRQLAANIYLHPSPQGGELELWRLRPTDTQYDAWRQGDSYGLDRIHLPAPTLTLHPQAGDLILFDSTRIHAVRAAQGGPRVSISCFVGYRGRNRALVYWS